MRSAHHNHPISPCDFALRRVSGLYFFSEKLCSILFMIFCYVKKNQKILGRSTRDAWHWSINKPTKIPWYTSHFTHFSILFLCHTEREGGRDTNKLTYGFFFRKAPKLLEQSKYYLTTDLVAIFFIRMVLGILWVLGTLAGTFAVGGSSFSFRCLHLLKHVLLI